MVMLNKTVACLGNDLLVKQNNYLCYEYAKGNMIASDFLQLSLETQEYINSLIHSARFDGVTLIFILWLFVLYYFIVSKKTFNDYFILGICSIIMISQVWGFFF